MTLCSWAKSRTIEQCQPNSTLTLGRINFFSWHFYIRESVYISDPCNSTDWVAAIKSLLLLDLPLTLATSQLIDITSFAALSSVCVICSKKLISLGWQSYISHSAWIPIDVLSQVLITMSLSTIDFLSEFLPCSFVLIRSDIYCSTVSCLLCCFSQPEAPLFQTYNLFCPPIHRRPLRQGRVFVIEVSRVLKIAVIIEVAMKLARSLPLGLEFQSVKFIFSIIQRICQHPSLNIPFEESCRKIH